MASGPLHAGELEIGSSLVSALLAEQVGRWADLPLQRVSSPGTSNLLYRLGTDLVVRLPRTRGSGAVLRKERRWLPRLSSLLPLETPTVVFSGRPTPYFPHPWGIYRWIEGDALGSSGSGDLSAAEALAGFVQALWRMDASGGPRPGAHNFYRGVDLARRDREVRRALPLLPPGTDRPRLEGAWEAALRRPIWDGPPRWIHGDLLPFNVLIREGRLVAVIDFGGLGVGDPATDLLPAWAVFGSAARSRFREALGVDAATWERGRGWALSVAAIALPYYLNSNPPLADLATAMLSSALEA